ncbi:hypothetical protein ACFL6U_32265 [Planctomycetota bacterium]
MQLRYGIQFVNGRLRTTGRPWIAGVMLVVLSWMGVAAVTWLGVLWDCYAPYEGTVVAVERHWLDHVGLESGDWEHLIIDTPDGRNIDKYVSIQQRVLQHIHVGDRVVKKRGFAQVTKQSSM